MHAKGAAERRASNVVPPFLDVVCAAHTHKQRASAPCAPLRADAAWGNGEEARTAEVILRNAREAGKQRWSRIRVHGLCGKGTGARCRRSSS